MREPAYAKGDARPLWKTHLIVPALRGWELLTEKEKLMAKRKSIHVKGMEHGAPIPNGVVIGNMVFSSAIGGKDAKNGVLSDDPDEQAAAMFRNWSVHGERGCTAANIAI